MPLGKGKSVGRSRSLLQSRTVSQCFKVNLEKPALDGKTAGKLPGLSVGRDPAFQLTTDCPVSDDS